jgi:hypothetical protein
LESVLEENRKLRERIELLENLNGEEDQKFSTPDGDVKEAETPKEAVRPPKNGHGNSGGSLEAETPKEAKKAKEAVRVTMDMLLRLRADGESNYPYTGDDPRANGRAEVAVKSIKTQIRRVLLQAEANASWWPWATRFVNELNRASRVGKMSWCARGNGVKALSTSPQRRCNTYMTWP